MFGGRGVRRVVEKGLQVAFEGDQFGDLRADLVQTGVQDLLHVPARHLTAVVDRQDLAHLLQGQPGGLAPMVNRSRSTTSGP